MHEFAEIWHRWWLHTPHLADEILWGHPVHWWARWGKIVQLVSVLTIVLDVVGPHAIRAAGTRWRATFNFQFIRPLLPGTYWLVRKIWSDILRRGPKREEAARDPWGKLERNTSKPFVMIWGAILFGSLLADIVIMYHLMTPWIAADPVALLAAPVVGTFGVLLLFGNYFSPPAGVYSCSLHSGFAVRRRDGALRVVPRIEIR